MNQAAVGSLIPKLKIPVHPRRSLPSSEGPYGRINKLRKTVTALIQYERIELYHPRADEARGYAERLITEAIRNGDTHEPTMELADFWLLKKELVHKLFKVLVPRFENFNISYTRMYKAPNLMEGYEMDLAVLELRGNPFPSLTQKMNNKYLLHNVLLDAARFEYRKNKYENAPEKIDPTADPPLITEEKETS